MSTPSNLYAEKVYAEHPIALWALDDAQTYISFISDTNRNVDTWTKTNCTTAPYTDVYPYSPFSSSSTTQVFFNGTGATVKLVSTANINPGTSDTFSIGFYLYSFSTKISAVRVGYQVGTSTPVLKTVSLKSDDNDATKIYDRYWHSISETFTSSASNRKIIIEFDFVTITSQSSVLINGVTAGSYSEEFNGTSLGVQYSTVPTNLYTAASYPNGNVAYAYGSDANVGYYLTSVNKTYARNSSTPMVYGSSSSTTLEPTDGMCLIVPGMGFLNDSGKHRELSFETWLRIIGKTTTTKRIFGPVASTDGLYIDGDHLVLKIDKYYGSHYLGELDRPMLVNINVGPTGARMMINGDEVIALTFDTLSINFPDKVISTKDADWIAFYSYSDAKVHIDCVAIYPYLVDTVLAKRRFVYAQGVEFPEQLNKAYLGESFVTDYAYSQFGNNYNYPDSAKWSVGIADNLADIDSTLSNVNFPKPQFYINGSTQDAFLSSQYSSGKTYLSFGSISGYLFFSDQSYFNSSTRAIYGVFNKTASGIGEPTDQTLIKIQNIVDGSYLKARLTDSKVTYVFKYQTNAEEVLHESSTITEGTNFVAGFDFESIKDVQSSTIASFLANPQNLMVYVANTEDYSETFFGRVYTVGFTSVKGWSKVSTYFDDTNGFTKDSLTPTNANTLFAINTTYSVKFKTMFDIQSMVVDIHSSGYWYDTVPLKLLAKTVAGETEGTTAYALDYIQINSDIPLPAESGGSYSTSSSTFRTFVHFQPLTTQGIVAGLTSVSAPADMVVSPSSDWATKKYEVVSGSIVKIPESLNINENMLVITVESDIAGIYYKPSFIRYLHIAGRALNKRGDNYISCKTGKKIYPYEQVSGVTVYNTISPISIGKQSMTYFYSTGQSGINIIGTPGSNDRGFELRMNENQASFFRVASIQAYTKYVRASFPTTETSIMSIQDGVARININVKSINSSNTRGVIYATRTLNGTTTDYKDLNLYINGNISKAPVLNIKEWAAIGISFLSPISFDSTKGSIKFNGNMLFDNISYYQAPEVELAASTTYRLWNDVSAEDWAFWDDSTWNALLVTTAVPKVFGVSPDLTYKAFTGTDRIIADSDIANTTMMLNNYQYKIFNTYSSNIQFVPAR
jgi:hypothetical protein